MRRSHPAGAPPSRAPVRSAWALALVPLLGAAGESADGERALLIVDPSDEAALCVANHYRAARAIPAGNVLHLSPGAADYAELAATKLPAFLGELEARGLEGQVDFVIVAPCSTTRVPAPGLVADDCFPVGSFSIASCYGLARQRDAILAGDVTSSSRNHFTRATWTALELDSETAYFQGLPSTDPAAERYFIGALLGYTGEGGNTPADLLALIDRSVAADATSPAGTVYYMQTSDVLRSGPRHGVYPTAVERMTAFGGAAEHLLADLPLGRHDCTGIMTGLAAPDVDGADLTLLPGSFADHLTSFAGAFDVPFQTKMSRWIAKGASGTSGTVEEPCNTPGKFPHARLHVVYRQGVTLGEAWLRSLGSKPFQSLFYGDPLTRPWGAPPVVRVELPPGSPVAGVLRLEPVAAATAPGAGIARLELYVDGARVDTGAPPAGFSLDTTRLADGWHELRVVAIDDRPAADRGRWTGAMQVSNRGREVKLRATGPLSGDLDERFSFACSAAGGRVEELRLMQGERVLAAARGSEATLDVHGRRIGAGPVRLQAEALFVDGMRARSAPIELSVVFAPGTPSGSPPVAHGYAKTLRAGRAAVVELPADFDGDPARAEFRVVDPPAAAAILGGEGPYRIVLPHPDATGEDALSFQVATPGGTSALATVRLRYETAETDAERAATRGR